MSNSVELFIDGRSRPGTGRRTLPFWNPATGEEIGTVAVAQTADLDEAAAAADASFSVWRHTSAYQRSGIMRAAASLARDRTDTIAKLLTLEQGKPLAQARQEVESAADILDWFAEEGRRAYGRLIPSRSQEVRLSVVKEPVGPVAAFSPWNFPLAQAARKIGAALASGCSIILKGPEETPAALAQMVACLHEAGVPGGVVNLVYGVPAEISAFLIPHPLVRKISFTGSTAVGKQLAALAGAHMKRTTMELGGHSATIVFDDANLDRAAALLTGFKFRNAGQVCTSPTRILVHENVYRAFRDNLVARAKALKVGSGDEDGVEMGPLANPRRLEAMSGIMEDIAGRSATVAIGGRRIGDKGNFFEPTILEDVPRSAPVMNQEPFGPIMLLEPFREFDAAIEEANRLTYGLAAYVYTRSAQTALLATDALEAGMVSINHHGLGLPETPFGGVKDSGYGSEGGSEAIEPYLISKFVTHAFAD